VKNKQFELSSKHIASLFDLSRIGRNDVFYDFGLARLKDRSLEGTLRYSGFCTLLESFSD